MFEEDSSLAFTILIIKETSSVILQTKKMEPVGVPEMSTPDHFKTLRNSPEDRRVHSGINPF
jgi:hypothetical protein